MALLASTGIVSFVLKSKCPPKHSSVAFVSDSFLEKVTVLFLSTYTHTPEGREKYVLALHECASSASLSMAFTSAPVPKCSLVSCNVAQHGEVLTLLSLIRTGASVFQLLTAQFLFYSIFFLSNLLRLHSMLSCMSKNSPSSSPLLHSVCSHAAAQIISGPSPGPYHDLGPTG